MRRDLRKTVIEKLRELTATDREFRSEARALLGMIPMNWLPDEIIDHLREVIEEPDLSGTRYSLEKEIGRGGMGVVYLVRDTVLDREVALKVLNRVDTTEAKTLAQLEHPGIVPVHDSGVLPDGRIYT